MNGQRLVVLQEVVFRAAFLDLCVLPVNHELVCFSFLPRLINLQDMNLCLVKYAFYRKACDNLT